jgi:hypothetical protein
MLVLAVLQTQLELIMQQELQEDLAHSQQSLQLEVVEEEEMLMEIPLVVVNLVDLEVVVDTAPHQMLLDHHQDQE